MKFDRFMVDAAIGRNLKVARLTPAERWTFVAGVLAIASMSPVRGALMIGTSAATDADVALAAGVTKKVAASTMRKLRSLEMLESDPELGAEWVHDWDSVQPEPKRDDTAAERARRYRERKKADRHADRNRDGRDASRRDGRDDHGSVTPPEVEGEVEETSLRSVTARARISDRVPDNLHSVVAHVHQRLGDLASARGEKQPTLLRVSEIVADFPDHDHQRHVGDVVDYWQHGDGAKTKRKDYARVYRDWLSRKPAGATVTNLRPGQPAALNTVAGFMAAQQARLDREDAAAAALPGPVVPTPDLGGAA